MLKTATAAASSGAAVRASGTLAGGAERRGVPVPKATTTAKQIDPAVRRAVQMVDIDSPLTVMVKLDTKKSAFGRFPVTNRPGSARERTFQQEIDAIVQDASTAGSYKIVSTAANVGVETVEASVGVVRDLLRSAKVAGMKLKAG